MVEIEYKFHVFILWFCFLTYFLFILIQLSNVKKKNQCYFYPIKSYVS